MENGKIPAILAITAATRARRASVLIDEIANNPYLSDLNLNQAVDFLSDAISILRPYLNNSDSSD